MSTLSHAVSKTIIFPDVGNALKSHE